MHPGKVFLIPRTTLIIGIAVLVAGCGGGGGGGATTPEPPQMPPQDPMPDPPPPPDVPPDRPFATDYLVAARAQTHLDAINYNVNEGHAGNGVTVAFLENGVDSDHPTLDELSLENAQTYADTDPGSVRHGTLVALLIGGRIGKEVYGSAYQAEQEFVCCSSFQHTSDPLINSYLEGVKYLKETSTAFVVNHSYGRMRLTITHVSDYKAKCEAIAVSGSGNCHLGFNLWLHNSGDLPSGYQDALHGACVAPDNVGETDMVKDRLCVFSAGNDGFHSKGIVKTDNGVRFSVEHLLDPADLLSKEIREWFEENLYKRGSYVGLPNKDPDFQGHLLVVAALADQENLASYSNGCGEAKQYCLSALGNIPLRLCGDPSGVCTGNSEGTSYAAPLVTGAAAVLKSTYPNLSAPKVSTILLTTAFDLNPGGERVDDDFGWGRLDLGEALKPSNAQTTSDGVRLKDTHIKAGFSMGAALAASTASFGMFDEHGRPYLHFVTSRLSSSHLDPALSLEDWQHSSVALMDMDFGTRMGLSGSQRGLALPGNLGLAALSGWDMGLEQCHLSCPFRRDVQVGSLVRSSALAWTQRHMQVPGGRMGLVLETGLQENGGMTYTNRGLFFESGLSEGLLRIEAGMLDEKATFMGTGFSGALDVRPGDSQYVSASLGIPVGENAFSAGYTLGKASSGLVANSYVTEIDDVSYDAYRLAFGGKRWELGYTVPLAARSGGMRIESIGGYTGSEGDWSIVPTDEGVVVLGESSAKDWSYRTDSHWIDLGAGARERRLGLTMARPYGAWDMTLAVEHVANSPRRSFAGDEMRAAVVLSLGL